MKTLLITVLLLFSASSLADYKQCVQTSKGTIKIYDKLDFFISRCEKNPSITYQKCQEMGVAIELMLRQNKQWRHDCDEAGHLDRWVNNNPKDTKKLQHLITNRMNRINKLRIQME